MFWVHVVSFRVLVPMDICKLCDWECAFISTRLLYVTDVHKHPDDDAQGHTARHIDMWQSTFSTLASHAIVFLKWILVQSI